MQCQELAGEKDLPAHPATGRAIWVLVLAFVALATTYSITTPLFEAPDELFHYSFVKHLADGHGLPVLDPSQLDPWRQEGGQPPLYYTLAALVSRWVPSDDLPHIQQRNPHASIGFVQPDGNANIVVHTPREAFPYRGAALALHLARLLSVALGALTVLFAYRLGLEVLPERPELALASAAVVAFTPMFLFLAGAVNNDNLIITLATLSLWQMVRLLRRPPTPARLGVLGVTIGLATLSKVSGLALLPLAALVLFYNCWRRRDWRLFIWGGACIVGATALVAGWWYWRNWRLYGDPIGLRAFLAIAGHREVTPNLHELLAEIPGFMVSYWGAFGWVNVIAPPWFYRLLNGLACLSAVGLVVGVGRCIWRRTWPGGDTAAALGLVAIWPLLVMVSLVRYTLLIPASVGRLVFPAIASLSYLMVLGWTGYAGRKTENVKRDASSVKRQTASVKRDEGLFSRLTPHASRLTFDVSRFTFHVSCIAPVALMAALAVWTPFGVIAPAYARPPLLTAAEQAAIPQRLDLSLGDEIELLGYRLDQAEARPGEELALTLYWRARAPMDDNYSVFIHLLDQNEVKIGQRDTYPGGGSFPTALWEPGDAIADTYVIRVPAETFRPNRLRLEVGLYSLESGKRLPVRDREGRELGRSVRLGELLVPAAPAGEIPNPLDANLGNRAALVGYDLDRTALRPGETLRLTLFWKALAPVGEGYTAFAHVLGPDGALWAGKAVPVGQWPEGQVAQAIYDLSLRPDTPPGEYYVDVGLYAAADGQSLGLLDRWGHTLDRRLVLTRIRVLPAAPSEAEAQFDLPPIAHPLDVAFGDVARLRGFSLDREVLNPHEPLRVTLYWQAVAAAPVDYTVFVHLLDGQGRLIAQHDGLPALGTWPTTRWAEGQVIVDEHDLSLLGVEPGAEARLAVGLYDLNTMQRLCTSDGDDKVILPARPAVQP